MKIHSNTQIIALISFLAACRPIAANPIPESYDASNLDYLSFLGNDPGTPETNRDDSSIWAPNQSSLGDESLSPTSAGLDQSSDLFASSNLYGTTDLTPTDTTTIALGAAIPLKAPYCGTTEQPVCCENLALFQGCKYFDPYDFEKCQGVNQGCCGRIDITSGLGDRCYKGSPERVPVTESPEDAPELQPANRYNNDPPDTQWYDWLRLAPLLFGPLLSPIGG